ncbi:hypothetical protein WSM22_04770 [Cytophagales bacterium WSM2-2]|nr:hypothetical protein WSM22_04770 [Cytophagales bacterium WSM2-2]
MKSKISRRVNGSMAIYYGAGLLITAFGILVAGAIWFYKNLISETDFSWWSLFGILLALTAFGLGGYSLVRTGQEELEG